MLDLLIPNGNGLERHGSMDSQAFGVRSVVVACKPAAYGLSEASGKSVLRVVTRSDVTML